MCSWYPSVSLSEGWWPFVLNLTLIFHKIVVLHYAKKKGSFFLYSFALIFHEPSGNGLGSESFAQ